MKKISKFSVTVAWLILTLFCMGSGSMSGCNPSGKATGTATFLFHNPDRYCVSIFLFDTGAGKEYSLASCNDEIQQEIQLQNNSSKYEIFAYLGTGGNNGLEPLQTFVTMALDPNLSSVTVMPDQNLEFDVIQPAKAQVEFHKTYDNNPVLDTDGYWITDGTLEITNCEAQTFTLKEHEYESLNWCSYSNTVTLKAMPTAHAKFSHWEGACSGSNPVCQIQADDQRQVTAHFINANTP